MEDAKWQMLVNRPQTVLTGDTLVHGFKNGKVLGLSYDHGWFFQDGRGQLFESRIVRRKITQIVDSWSYADLRGFVTRGEKVCAKLLTYEPQLQLPIDKQCQSYLEILSELIPYLYIVFSIEVVVEKRLQALLPKGTHLEAILNNPLLLSDNAFFDREALQAALGGCQPQTIVSLSSKYGYLQLTNHLASNPFTKDDVLQICQKLIDPRVELSRIKQKDNELVRAYKLKVNHLNSEAKKYLQLMHRYQIFRNERIKAFKLLQYRLLRPIVEVVAELNGVSFDDLTWYTLEEFVDYSRNHKPIDVTAREKSYCMLQSNCRIYYSAKPPFNIVAEEKAALIGRSAQRGRASGKVRIILGAEEANKLKPGEILVTTMTTPDLVQAMQKAAAIVTDEGGILCHAAIISRELGIPCVIGTRQATKILKTGDNIVVDATSGTVYT